MDDIAGQRGRKGDDSSRAVLTRPGLPSPSSPFGSGPLPSPPSAAVVLALPVFRSPATSQGAGLLASSGLAGEMDAGGEPLLVRRSKSKNKRPRTAAPAERGSSSSGNRFRALWRDYDDLLQETGPKKKRLASMKGRNLALLAEVKFLRRKYRSFLKGGLQQKQHYKLKKQARYIPSPLGSNRATAFAGHGSGTEVSSTSKNPSFDLNQDSVLNDVGNDCQGQQGHPEVEKFDQVGVDEDMMTDVKLSVCRDTGNSPASEGKRTVPWQDRLALKA